MKAIGLLENAMPPNKRHLLLNVETGMTHPALTAEPVLSSANGPWKGVMLEQHDSTEVEMIDLAPPDHRVVLQIRGTALVEWKEQGRFRTIRVEPGDVAIFPAMVPFSARSKETGSFIAVSIEPAFLRFAAHDLIAAPEQVELKQVVAIKDPLLEALVLGLKSEAASFYPGGRVYGESLGTSLALHLVRHYVMRQPLLHSERGGLARPQLRRVLDYIQEHLAEDISLRTIATEAGLSPYHFARLFKKATGLAPHQYLVRCRVDRAQQLLISTRSNTADIAQQVGFCDQSHLTTHFKRVYGLTPKVFRQQASLRKKIP